MDLLLCQHNPFDENEWRDRFAISRPIVDARQLTEVTLTFEVTALLRCHTPEDAYVRTQHITKHPWWVENKASVDMMCVAQARSTSLNDLMIELEDGMPVAIHRVDSVGFESIDLRKPELNEDDFKVVADLITVLMMKWVLFNVYRYVN